MTPKHIAMLAVLLLAGCQRDGNDGPTEISGKMFVFNYRVATATYLVTLARTAPLPENGIVVTEYEDPRGGAPLVTRAKLFPFWEKIVLESPALHCVVKNRPYRVGIRILDAGGKELQALETTVTSRLDQTVLPAKPLVVGPGYARNPEIFNADGVADYAPESGCPA